MKHEKSQPHDTTGKGKGGTAAPQASDGYNSDSVGKKGNYHQAPKARQDGKGSGTSGTASGDHLWKHEHSVGKGPGKK